MKILTSFQKYYSYFKISSHMNLLSTFNAPILSCALYLIDNSNSYKCDGNGIVSLWSSPKQRTDCNCNRVIARASVTDRHNEVQRISPIFQNPVSHTSEIQKLFNFITNFIVIFYWFRLSIIALNREAIVVAEWPKQSFNASVNLQRAERSFRFVVFVLPQL